MRKTGWQQLHKCSKQYTNKYTNLPPLGDNIWVHTQGDNVNTFISQEWLVFPALQYGMIAVGRYHCLGHRHPYNHRQKSPHPTPT